MFFFNLTQSASCKSIKKRHLAYFYSCVDTGQPVEISDHDEIWKDFVHLVQPWLFFYDKLIESIDTEATTHKNFFLDFFSTTETKSPKQNQNSKARALSRCLLVSLKTGIVRLCRSVARHSKKTREIVICQLRLCEKKL